MFPIPEFAIAVQRDRVRDLGRPRLAAFAAVARACCGASLTLIDRIVRIVRPAPNAC